MSDPETTGNEQNPPDAKYCPSCGETLPFSVVQLYADDLLNRYRASFKCPSCEYKGEVIRKGGLSDISLNLIQQGGNPLGKIDTETEK